MGNNPNLADPILSGAPSHDGTQNVTDLSNRFNTSRYLAPTSDLVALLVLEHQIRMTNLMVRVGWDTRVAQHDGTLDTVRSQLDAELDEMVAYMLFGDEAQLQEPVSGVSTFSKTFAQRGPRDKHGRSLRDFDLKTRLFRYPLSYMIYSAAFDGMPDLVRARVYRRLYDILTGQDASKSVGGLSLENLSAADRRAILGNRPRYQAEPAWVLGCEQQIDCPYHSDIKLVIRHPAHLAVSRVYGCSVYNKHATESSESMNITEIFIKRPVMTALVMMGIVLFGIAGYRALPVSDLPSVDFPTLQVSASLPGANPETMASAVATPLERQFATVAGIDSMTSSSGIGVTNITIQFTLDRSIDGAAADVQSAVATVLKRLPPGMTAPPTVQKVNPADQPVIILMMSAPTLQLSQLDEYAENLMAQRISMLNGVAQVNVFGAQKWAIHVQLDPSLLAARRIGIDEVHAALQAHNVNQPTGTLWGKNQAFTVRANGQLMTADAFRNMIVAYRNGSPVRLRDLGNVIDGVQDDRSAMWSYTNQGVGRRSIAMGVLRQPGANTVDVTARIKGLLPAFREILPPSVTLNIDQDRSEPVLESVNDVKFTLLLTMGLVVLVIFLFLRNLSATAIPSLALPISVIGTFAAMNLLGYSLDNLSLMALTLSVGFVVDDAIVVLENIVRHMEMGKPRMVAALEGAREIGFTVLSMTLSLTAVFIPVMFMSGIIGRLFHEFAVTIMVAILISGFVSISLTPMLCSRFLKPPSSERHNVLYRAAGEAALDGARDASCYEAWALRGVMRYRPLTMLVAAGTLAATVYLLVVTPKGFIPPQDYSTLNGTVEAGQDISFDAMKALQMRVAATVGGDPNIEHFGSFLGGAMGRSVNQGILFLVLKPRSERKLTPEQVIEELRPKLAAIPGARVYMTNPPLVRIGGQQTRALYQFTLQSTDLNTLYASAADLEKRMRTLPGLADVNSDLQIRSPILNVDIDRNRASSLGVTEAQIENALNDSYGQPQISTIYTQVDSYWVMLEVKPEYQRDSNGLGLLYLRSSGGNSGAAERCRQADQRRGAVDDPAFWRTAGRDHFIQYPTRRVAGRCRRSRPGLGSPNFARLREHHFPGHGRRVSVFSPRHGVAADHGRPGHLHGAGYSVRELHSPHHHSFGTPFGRPGRSRYAIDLPR